MIILIRREGGARMSFQMALLFCFVLMCLVGIATYYLGKKVSQRYTKYIPVFAFGIGVLFFYIKLNFLTVDSSSFENISGQIVMIILLVLCSFALLEAIIMEIVENTQSIGKRFMDIQKALKLIIKNKKQV